MSSRLLLPDVHEQRFFRWDVPFEQQPPHIQVEIAALAGKRDAENPNNTVERCLAQYKSRHDPYLAAVYRASFAGKLLPTRPKDRRVEERAVVIPLAFPDTPRPRPQVPPQARQGQEPLAQHEPPTPSRAEIKAQRHQQCRKEGAALRAQREEWKLSQRQLAELLGISFTLLSHWERGRVPIPTKHQQRMQELFRDPHLIQAQRKPEKNQAAKNREECKQANAPLRAKRYALGLSQAQMGEVLGVNQHTISTWECGYAALPADTLTYIASLPAPSTQQETPAAFSVSALLPASAEMSARIDSLITLLALLKLRWESGTLSAEERLLWAKKLSAEKGIVIELCQLGTS